MPNRGCDCFEIDFYQVTGNMNVVQQPRMLTDMKSLRSHFCTSDPNLRMPISGNLDEYQDLDTGFVVYAIVNAILGLTGI